MIKKARNETRTNVDWSVEANGWHLSTCGYAEVPSVQRISRGTDGTEHRSDVDVPAVAELTTSDVSDSEVAVPALAGTILRNFGIPVFIVR